MVVTHNSYDLLKTHKNTNSCQAISRNHMNIYNTWKLIKVMWKWVNIIIIILKNIFYKSKTDWDNDSNPFPATKHEKTAHHAPTRRVHDPTRRVGWICTWTRRVLPMNSASPVDSEQNFRFSSSFASSIQKTILGSDTTDGFWAF